MAKNSKKQYPRTWQRRPAEVWALVDSEGNIVEKFRNLNALYSWRPRLDSEHFQNLKIVFLPHSKIEEGKVIFKE